MEPQVKESNKLRKSLFISLALIAGVVVGSSVMWVLSRPTFLDMQAEIDSQKVEISKLKENSELDGKSEEAQGDRKESVRDLTDRQTLQILTIDRSEQSDVADFWAPIDIKISDEYARTGALPISFSNEAGYQVVPMGGTSYFWHKDDAGWKYIGSCTVETCQMEPGFKYEDLPDTVIR